MIIPPLKPIGLESVRTGSNIPEVYQWLAEEEDDIVVLELPFWIDAENQSVKYMYYSTYHWKKLINGYSGYYPPEYMEFTLKPLKDMLNDDTIKEIKERGANYIIMHTNASAEFIQELQESDFESNEHLLLVEKFGYDHVYQLR